MSSGLTASGRARADWRRYVVAPILGLAFLSAVFERHRERGCRALLERAEEANREPVRTPIEGFADATRAAALAPAWGTCRDRALRLRLSFGQELTQDPVK